VPDAMALPTLHLDPTLCGASSRSPDRHGLAGFAALQRANGPWLAIAQLVRLHSGLGAGWIFELEAGVAEPIVRDVFVFRDPDVNIVRVPRVVPTLQAGVALELR